MENSSVPTDELAQDVSTALVNMEESSLPIAQDATALTEAKDVFQMDDSAAETETATSSVASATELVLEDDVPVSETVALATEIALATIPQITAWSNHKAQALGNPYVKLKLNHQTLAVVNTDWVQEVMVIPQQRLTVIPNMPPTVMGLINHRSRIFWILDLPQLFGLPPLDPLSLEYHLAILQANEMYVGIAVQQVEGITRFCAEEIQSPLDQDMAAGLVPYLKGCIPQPEETLLVLDALALAVYSTA